MKIPPCSKCNGVIKLTSKLIQSHECSGICSNCGEDFSIFEISDRFDAFIQLKFEAWSKDRDEKLITELEARAGEWSRDVMTAHYVPGLRATVEFLKTGKWNPHS